MTPVPPPSSIVASIDQLAAEFAARVETWSDEAIAARGIFSLALPGGSVASAFLPPLAQSRVRWEAVHLFWVDERAVAVTAPASNAGLARRLTEGTPMAKASWHMVAASPAVLGASAAAYARQLIKVVGDPPVLDVVLLGVGADGHVASLFPTTEPTPRHTDLPVLAVDNAPKPPRHRVTLSLTTICSARQVVIAAFGHAKRPVIKELMENPLSSLPVARVVQAAPPPRSILMLDAAAAGEGFADAR